MRILDMFDNEIFEYDRNTHYLIEDTIISAHYDEVPFIKEEGHYETIAEYPNGGKDVKWVIDVPGQEYQAAYDEYETVLRLTAFEESDLLDPDLMESLRHDTEKTAIQEEQEQDRISILENEIAELKAIINSLINKE